MTPCSPTNCRRAVWPRESQGSQNQEIRRQSWHRTGHIAWDRSNQHPSPTGHPLLEGYLVQNIRIGFPGTGHHHPERSRCHRHPGAHRWYHRPPRLQSLNHGHVRKVTSPKEDIPSPRCCLPFSGTRLLHRIYVQIPYGPSNFLANFAATKFAADESIFFRFQTKLPILNLTSRLVRL